MQNHPMNEDSLPLTIPRDLEALNAIDTDLQAVRFLG